VTPTGEKLLERARERFGEVFPCAGRNWEGCLTEERGMIMFWFDTPDKNTHLLYERESALGGGGDGRVHETAYPH
jgi:hypothetical protein